MPLWFANYLELSLVLLVHSYPEYKYKKHSSIQGIRCCPVSKSREKISGILETEFSNCDNSVIQMKYYPAFVYDNSVSLRSSRNEEASIHFSMSAINCTNCCQWFSLKGHWNRSTVLNEELVSEDFRNRTTFARGEKKSFIIGYQEVKRKKRQTRDWFPVILSNYKDHLKKKKKATASFVTNS